MFPVEAVPDGAIWGPHHAHYGFLAALVVLAVVWDDYRGVEPVAALASVAGAWFGFALVWPFYPVVGASMAVALPVLALAAVWVPFVGVDWSELYPRRLAVVSSACMFVALDDVLEHAFGFPTPLDTGWAVLGPVVSSVIALVAAVAGVAAVASSSSRVSGVSDGR